jgi:hypothetical protein
VPDCTKQQNCPFNARLAKVHITRCNHFNIPSSGNCILEIHRTLFLLLFDKPFPIAPLI